MSENEDSALNVFVNLGLSLNLNYLKYYVNLINSYDSDSELKESLHNELFEKWQMTINSKFSDDHNSKLGVYFTINPSLVKFEYNPQNILEIERRLITRYHTG